MSSIGSFWAIGINNLHATNKTYDPLARSISGVSDTPSPLHSRGTTSSVGSKVRFLNLFFKKKYSLFVTRGATPRYLSIIQDKEDLGKERAGFRLGL